MDKKHPWGLWAALIILIIGTIIIGYKACNLYDELSVQKGKYEAYREVAKADYAKVAQVVIGQKNIIAAKDAEIAVHKQSVFKKSEQIAKTNTKLSDLEASYSILSTDVLKIDNLTQQVAGWKAQFSLAQEVIAEKDKIIAAWEVKFDAQVVISDEYKAGWDREIQLRKMCEGMVSGLEGKLRRTSFFAKAVTGVAVVAGGYIGYKLVK